MWKNRHYSAFILLVIIWMFMGVSWGAGGSGGKSGTVRAVNVVFILVDDLGWSDLGCYGNRLHETPHVDGLARAGMRFTQAYTACAVCSPTRASIQTGKYPIRMGITDWIPGAKKKNTLLKEKYTATEMGLSEVTLGEALAKQGYRCAMLGKWHLGDTGFMPQDQGYFPYIDKPALGFQYGYFNPPIKKSEPPAAESQYLTDRLGDKAVELIDEFAQTPERPFMLMMNFHTVHLPIQPRDDLRKYYEKKLKTLPGCPWKDAGYAGMVHCMDLNVGKILKALANNGLEENTMVVFTSDNGGLTKKGITTNTPLRSGKGYYYEGGIRVPTIVRWPGKVKANSTCDTAIISMDYYPTILEMLGLKLMPEQHRDGMSLAGLLTQRQETLERDSFYWHYPHYHGAGETPCSAIRQGDYKLIRHYEDGRKELYNIREDMSETRDLIGQKPKLAKQMETELDRWLREMGGYIPVRR